MNTGGGEIEREELSILVCKDVIVSARAKLHMEMSEESISQSFGVR